MPGSGGALRSSVVICLDTHLGFLRKNTALYQVVVILSCDSLYGVALCMVILTILLQERNFYGFYQEPFVHADAVHPLKPGKQIVQPYDVLERKTHEATTRRVVRLVRARALRSKLIPQVEVFDTYQGTPSPNHFRHHAGRWLFPFGWGGIA